MQFDDKPKRCSHVGPITEYGSPPTFACANEGTIFRDCTRGPLYDPRFFCEDHISEADAIEKKISKEAHLCYQRSVITNLENKLEEEKAKLSEMEND